MLKLKKIHILGFKSFCDRTEVTVAGTGIAVVVGPNGCGKSNILDGVSWVLGEQSAKTLRGSHMQDLIFAGTRDRKALGMAEVTLTMIDPDSVSMHVPLSHDLYYPVSYGPNRRPHGCSLIKARVYITRWLPVQISLHAVGRGHAASNRYRQWLRPISNFRHRLAEGHRTLGFARRSLQLRYVLFDHNVLLTKMRVDYGHL